MLHTKFKELETMLDDAILRGPETNSEQDIKHKLKFVGNLLSAEVKSHDPSKQQHLHNMSQKLESLKNSFNERDNNFTTFTNPEFDKDSISSSNDNDNSTCSSNESSLNGNDDESELIVLDDPDKLLPESVGENTVVEFRGNGVEKIREKNEKIGSFLYEDAEGSFEDFDDKEKELVELDCCLKEDEKKDNNNNNDDELEKRKSRFGKNCCVLAKGVVIGMILMMFIMVNFSVCFHYVERFDIPT